MNQTPNKKIVIAITIVLLALAAGGVYVLTRNTQSDTTDLSTEQTSQTETSQDVSDVPSSSYVNGTYNAVGSYRSPAGNESIEVRLTLADGTVSDADVTSKATNSTSRGYQRDFIDSYKSEVIGKSIADLELDAVSGSSLTPNGFNEALEQIRQDAAA